MLASGPFEVKLTPQPPTTGLEPARLGRQTIDKRFHGELEAYSLGEMLSVAGEVPGSAGYVAIERVEGRLHGRQGSFVLQHHGVMDRGVPTLSVTVVPDSGSGELAGLRGTMQIRIEQGQHTYHFEYELAEA